MRNLYTFLFVLTVFAGGYCRASNAALFILDENKIYEEFSSVNELEKFVGNNEGITRNDVIAKVNAGEINFPVTEIGKCVSLAEPPLGIPSFVWGLAGGLLGCCSGYGFWVGPAVVAGVYFLTDEDKEEAKKAAYGCIAGGVVGLAVFVFYFAAVLGLNFASF